MPRERKPLFLVEVKELSDEQVVAEARPYKKRVGERELEYMVVQVHVPKKLRKFKKFVLVPIE